MLHGNTVLGKTFQAEFQTYIKERNTSLSDAATKQKQKTGVSLFRLNRLTQYFIKIPVYYHHLSENT